jgi:hypothetical protein
LVKFAPVTMSPPATRQHRGKTLHPHLVHFESGIGRMVLEIAVLEKNRKPLGVQAVDGICSTSAAG